VMSTYRQYLCISTILIAFTGALSTYPSFWWRDTILNWAEFKIRLRQQSLQMATDFVLVEVDTNTNNETEEGFVVVDKSTQT